MAQVSRSPFNPLSPKRDSSMPALSQIGGKVENIDYRTVDENACLLKLPGKINPTKLVENVHEINRQSDVRS